MKCLPKGTLVFCLVFSHGGGGTRRIVLELKSDSDCPAPPFTLQGAPLPSTTAVALTEAPGARHLPPAQPSSLLLSPMHLLQPPSGAAHRF